MVNIMNWPFYYLCWFYLVTVLVFVGVMTVSTYMYIYIYSIIQYVCVYIYTEYMCIYIYTWVHPGSNTSSHQIISLRVFSPGTMWINMEKRAFRLNGNAKNTKVGDLHIETCHGSSSDCSGVWFFCFICFSRMFWQEVKTWKNIRFVEVFGKDNHIPILRMLSLANRYRWNGTRVLDTAQLFL